MDYFSYGENIVLLKMRGVNPILPDEYAKQDQQVQQHLHPLPKEADIRGVRRVESSTSTAVSGCDAIRPV
jgi:hypothetical protein